MTVKRTVSGILALLLMLVLTFATSLIVFAEENDAEEVGATEPATEPVTEPATEPVTDPVTDPAEDDDTQGTADNSTTPSTAETNGTWKTISNVLGYVCLVLIPVAAVVACILLAPHKKKIGKSKKK